MADTPARWPLLYALPNHLHEGLRLDLFDIQARFRWLVDHTLLAHSSDHADTLYGVWYIRAQISLLLSKAFS